MGSPPAPVGFAGGISTFFVGGGLRFVFLTGPVGPVGLVGLVGLGRLALMICCWIGTAFSMKSRQIGAHRWPPVAPSISLYGSLRSSFPFLSRFSCATQITV